MFLDFVIFTQTTFKESHSSWHDVERNRPVKKNWLQYRDILQVLSKQQAFKKIEDEISHFETIVVLFKNESVKIFEKQINSDTVLKSERGVERRSKDK